MGDKMLYSPCGNLSWVSWEQAESVYTVKSAEVPVTLTSNADPRSEARKHPCPAVAAYSPAEQHLIGRFSAGEKPAAVCSFFCPSGRRPTLQSMRNLSDRQRERRCQASRGPVVSLLTFVFSARSQSVLFGPSWSPSALLDPAWPCSVALFGQLLHAATCSPPLSRQPVINVSS
ncbi:hypothetical protein SKAU_G00105050 [Synaphobranchus kaupii]|uniref:Uncharacterized protein n=1 Tax=Synaphobranchus kaupii TaxID=118154 RepID=A0A9Q1FZZ7_SYNKA|nr:hypothetical protein SKAU_G00105050 [Synaphobranchus kaupii]